MKEVATLGLILGLGVPAAYGHDTSVRMTFQGTSESAATNLQQPNTSNDEDHFAGDGTLGRFTLHQLRAVSNAPDPSGSCPGANQTPFAEPSGAGVFRFDDGSLLEVTLVRGRDCIDFTAGEAHCTITFQILRGTRRLKNAFGKLNFKEVVKPVLADALGNPVFFAATGEFTGTISGVANEDGHADDGH